MIKKKYLFSFIFLLAASFFVVSNFTFAQDFGLQPVEDQIALSSDDPRAIIARIIQIVLSFLGVIILVLMIYAGFLYMTSGGDQEKISKAKRILQNAAIGLLITLSAWGITTFVLSRLYGATTGNETVSNYGNNPNLGGNYGFGAIGNCSIENTYPENNQKDVPRNTSILLSFREPIGLSSVCVDNSGTACSCDNNACSRLNPEVIRIYSDDLQDACSDTCPSVNSNVSDVMVSVSSDNTSLVLTPLEYLGNADRKTAYTVKVTSDLKKSNNTSMFATCSSDNLVWGFEVGTVVDLDPPKIVSQYLFPQPDNSADTSGVASPAEKAQAQIFVKDCPQIYQSATLISVSPDAQVDLNYHGSISNFLVSVPAQDPNKAQLYNADNNTLLGVADFDDQNMVNFTDYFSLKADNRQAGSLWQISIKPEEKADTLSVGSTTYIFSSNSSNNNILSNPSSCSIQDQAANIQAKLSGNSDIQVELFGNRVILTSKVAGESGNDINLSTTALNALDLTLFSGGTDSQSTYQINDKKDTAMNSVLKVSFNEAMNPLTLSGTAQDVANYIRVVNAEAGALPNGNTCSQNSDCLSYNCQSGSCQGNYVNGRFMLSGGYKILEFISDNECGINGCGEKVYCLPASSNLAIEIRAADLNTCQSDQDCLAFSPYKSCVLGALGYRTCQDNNSRNYPASDMTSVSGAMDLAFNSLDGNRDSLAQGPISYFYENSPNPNNRDSYKYSFFVSSSKQLSSPQVTSIYPTLGQSGIIALTKPVEITFNTLMMASTLRSGSVKAESKNGQLEHKLINLFSNAQTPLGYWVTSRDIDSNPLDNVSDISVAEIKHSPFDQSLSYSAQIGSGVKDIYQNCYKPSTGPGCNADWENPSCCFGVVTSSLNEQGNCQ